MTTELRYGAGRSKQTEWKSRRQTPRTGCCAGSYDDGRDALLMLYDKGKRQQWDAAERIDWSQGPRSREPDGAGPTRPSRSSASPMWGASQRGGSATICGAISRPGRSRNSCTGEQGALVCTAKNRPAGAAYRRQVSTAANPGRRRGAPCRGLFAPPCTRSSSWPIRSPARSRLCSRIRSAMARWDFTYLGMQVLIEGLALGAFQRIRDPGAETRSPPRSTPMSCRTRRATSRSAASCCATITPHLTEAERDEREAFVRRGVLPHCRDPLPRRGIVGDHRPAPRRSAWNMPATRCR